MKLFTTSTCSNQHNSFHHHLHAFLIMCDDQSGQQRPYCVCSHRLQGVSSVFELHHLWPCTVRVAIYGMVKCCTLELSSSHTTPARVCCLARLRFCGGLAEDSSFLEYDAMSLVA
jgi:hypothetical protein